MDFDFLTLDDLNLVGKTVFVRADFNVPIDPASGLILDETRIRSIKETLQSLTKSKVVVGSHQGRPGKDDFTSLEDHSEVLRKHTTQRVHFVEDVIGPEARKAIKSLGPGEVLLLDNLRLCAEENLEEEPAKLTKTIMVRTLAPFFDAYVNDAFSAAHRSQPSIVAFPLVLPSAAGRLLERELNSLKRLIVSPEHPSTYVLGGEKVDDKLPVVENIVRNNQADRVLVGGLTATVFLKAAGKRVTSEDGKKIESLEEYIDRAKSILDKYGDRIALPTDLAYDKSGERLDTPVDTPPSAGASQDIGTETASEYGRVIERSNTVVASGPMGVFERTGFDVGSRAVLEAMASSKGFTAIGGGHLAGLASMLKLVSKFSYVSTAGGAMLSMLAGEELPAVRALVESAKKHRKSAA